MKEISKFSSFQQEGRKERKKIPKSRFRFVFGRGNIFYRCDKKFFKKTFASQFYSSIPNGAVSVSTFFGELNGLRLHTSIS